MRMQYVRDRVWFVRQYGERNIDRTGAQTMLYLTCTMIFSVDLTHYGISRAKNWASVDCGTNSFWMNAKMEKSINEFIRTVGQELHSSLTLLHSERPNYIQFWPF